MPYKILTCHLLSWILQPKLQEPVPDLEKNLLSVQTRFSNISTGRCLLSCHLVVGKSALEGGPFQASRFLAFRVDLLHVVSFALIWRVFTLLKSGPRLDINVNTALTTRVTPFICTISSRNSGLN